MGKCEKTTVTMGQLSHVENTGEKKFNEADVYVAVWVEDADGSNKRCILFTDGEIHRAEKRAAKNPEDQPKLKKSSFWSRLFGC